MITEPTLYKRTSSGKIQIWYAEIDGAAYRTTSGQLDGKKTTSEWTYVEGKNIGRANETTPEEQAIKQVEALYEKQLKAKYFRNIEDVDQKLFFEPMTAKKWQDRKDKITLDMVYIQPKLDGMRCVAQKSGLTSRNGEPIVSVPHIMEALVPFFEKYPDVVLDGELYNHDLKDDFNKIMSLCKKTKNIKDSDFAEAKEKVQFHIYDSFLPNNPTADFDRRIEFVDNFVPANPSLVLVKTMIVHIDDVDETAAEFIAEGYEGAMIRLPGPYVNKRSDTLLKWKEMQDEEFRIVQIIEGNGNKAGWAASVELALPNGQVFNAGVIGKEEYARELLRTKDEHIGKMGTVVFQNYTPDGIPRFGKFKAVREDYE